jgi:hypothetical protein
VVVSVLQLSLFLHTHHRRISQKAWLLRLIILLLLLPIIILFLLILIIIHGSVAFILEIIIAHILSIFPKHLDRISTQRTHAIFRENNEIILRFKNLPITLTGGQRIGPTIQASMTRGSIGRMSNFIEMIQHGYFIRRVVRVEVGKTERMRVVFRSIRGVGGFIVVIVAVILVTTALPLPLLLLVTPTHTVH